MTRESDDDKTHLERKRHELNHRLNLSSKNPRTMAVVDAIEAEDGEEDLYKEQGEDTELDEENPIHQTIEGIYLNHANRNREISADYEFTNRADHHRHQPFPCSTRYQNLAHEAGKDDEGKMIGLDILNLPTSINRQGGELVEDFTDWQQRQTSLRQRAVGHSVDDMQRTVGLQATNFLQTVHEAVHADGEYFEHELHDKDLDGFSTESGDEYPIPDPLKENQCGTVTVQTQQARAVTSDFQEAKTKPMEEAGSVRSRSLYSRREPQEANGSVDYESEGRASPSGPFSPLRERSQFSFDAGHLQPLIQSLRVLPWRCQNLRQDSKGSFNNITIRDHIRLLLLLPSSRRHKP
jgi:hypothetical protein